MVGVCYRSPNASEAESENLIKSIENAANSCAIILGDFTTQILFGRNWRQIALVNFFWIK